MQPERFGASFGRYSGFYLNPNLAATICLLGYSLSFAMRNIKWKLLGQILFTVGGLFTLSRTFIVVWLLITIIAIYRNKRNIVAPMIGAVTLILIFTFSGNLTLESRRFGALQSMLGQGNESTEVIGEDRRDQTWAHYYDLIFDKPFVGHGFLNFQKKGIGLPGVHNSFLMVIGEAGIIPFIIMLMIYIQMLLRSYFFFDSHPWYLYITITLILSMMAGHGYFKNFITVFLSLYVYIRLFDLSTSAYSIKKSSKYINI
jgi:O-antigen ligase